MTPDSLHVGEYQVTRQDQCKQKLGPRTEPIYDHWNHNVYNSHMLNEAYVKSRIQQTLSTCFILSSISEKAGENADEFWVAQSETIRHSSR